MIQRTEYLDKLISKKQNGMIKVITGIRRCGKSYLLFRLFKQRLLDNGVPGDHIIEASLDGVEYEELLDRKKLFDYVRSKIIDGQAILHPPRRNPRGGGVRIGPQQPFENSQCRLLRYGI